MTKARRALWVAYAIKQDLPLNRLTANPSAQRSRKEDGKPAMSNKTAPFQLFLCIRKRQVSITTGLVQTAQSSSAQSAEEGDRLTRLYDRINGDLIYVSLDRIVRAADFLLDMPFPL